MMVGGPKSENFREGLEMVVRGKYFNTIYTLVEK